MASKLKIKVNGLVHNVTASLDTPLLYVLHNELHLHGPRFGCGLAQCGACSVLLDGKEIRSCVTPTRGDVGAADDTPVAEWPQAGGSTRGSAGGSGAVRGGIGLAAAGEKVRSSEMVDRKDWQWLRKASLWFGSRSRARPTRR